MSSNWEVYRRTTPSIVLPAVANGAYEIQVVAIDAFGNRSDAYVAPIQEVDRSASGATGSGETIERVRNASVVPYGEWLAQASWAQIDNDALSVAIRHSPDTSGATWSTSNPLVTGVIANSAGQMLLPALSGTYLFRHQNDGGAVSETTSVVFQVPKTSTEIIATIDEAATGFTGEKRNCAFDNAIGALRLNDTYWNDLALDGDFNALPGPIDQYGAPTVDLGTWDDLAEDGDFAALPGPIDKYGFDSREATYNFAGTFDAGSVKALQLSRIVRSRSRLVASSWGALLGPFDEILSINDEGAESGVVRVEYQESMDAISAGWAGSWSAWQPLTRSIVRARSLKFRALLSVDDINQDIVVSSLAVEVAVAANTGNRAVETSFTTAVISQYEIFDFAMELGELSILFSLQISEPSWVKIYRSSEQRSADPRSSPGGTLQALIDLGDKRAYAEKVTTLTSETVILNPASILTGDANGMVYLRLVKRSVGSGAVTLTTMTYPLIA